MGADRIDMLMKKPIGPIPIGHMICKNWKILASTNPSVQYSLAPFLGSDQSARR